MIKFRHPRLIAEIHDGRLTIKTLYYLHRTLEFIDLEGIAGILCRADAKSFISDCPGGRIFSRQFGHRFVVLRDPRPGLNGPISESGPVVLLHPDDCCSLLVIRNVQRGTRNRIEITLHGEWLMHTAEFGKYMDEVT